jgi:Sugar kinases, ribokinase family
MTGFALMIGESLVDLVKKVGTTDEPVVHPGGSPLNVALTLGRLGRPVQLSTWFAGDNYGNKIKAHLDESGVQIAAGSDGAGHTTTALALLDENGSATYEFDVDWNISREIPIAEEALFVHTGSLGAVLEPGRRVVLQAIKEAAKSALISYDPNARPTIMEPAPKTRALAEEYVAQADLIKVSDEDLDWLYPGQAAEEVLARWFDISDLGLVVLTRGKDGPAAWTRNGVFVERTPKPVKVVDTVGAGDSFMGALIDALWTRGITGRSGARKLASLSEIEVGEVLDHANSVANVTVSRAGANPPWASEL